MNSTKKGEIAKC